MATPAETWLKVVEEAAGCTRCDLHARATQTVFGEGPVPATAMMIGEQPGDQEDRVGAPFVGPAGHVLDEALEAAGLRRDRLYLTNAVKHFKWSPRGKRRIHQKPTREEVEACAQWLECEVSLVRPRVVTLLGATAAQAVMGPQFRVTVERGKLLDSPFAPAVLATVHPSSILRTPTPEERHRAMDAFVADLRVVAAAVDERTVG